MPRGKLRNIANEFMSIATECIVEDTFFRLARQEDGLIQTLWNEIRKGEVFGYATVTPFFTKVNGAYTVDFKTHYWSDVIPAPGTRNMNSGDIFIREWWAKDDVKMLLKSKDVEGLNKKALKRLLKKGATSRPSVEQSALNERAAVQNLGLPVIKYYVKEKGKFMLYVFQEGGEDFIMKQELPSRGHVTFYYDHDDETAYGNSIISLVGGIQIDLDQAQQSRRKAQRMEVDPMVIAKGVSMSRAQVKPGTILTVPEKASFDVFEMKTPSLLNYNQNHTADQALVYNLVGYTEANVPGGMSGASEIGKTPTAIKQAQGNLAAADNQVQHNLKLFLELLVKESLAIYFDALPDQFILEVSQEYEARMAQVAPERIIEDGAVLITNELDLYDFDIDIKSSTDDVNAQKLDSIMKVVGMISQFEPMQQRFLSLGIMDDFIKEIVMSSGLQNDNMVKKLSFLDNPNMAMSPNPQDPFAGQPIPPELAMQMTQGGGDGGQSPPPGMQQNPQSPNPVRQQGVM
jgi:hypothetical protein